MNSSNPLESLEQVNDWLTKKLQLTEEQVREGEDVNSTLTDENRHLKAAKTLLTAKLDELTGELEHLRSSVQEHSYEKQSLLSSIANLDQQLGEYKDEERNAKLLAEELKYEMDKAQEVISNNIQEIEDMREHIAFLESRNGDLQQSTVRQHQEMTKIIEEKDNAMGEIQRKLLDVESSLSMQVPLTEVGGERADAILAGMNDAADMVSHSSPVEPAGSVAYLQHKLDEKDSSIKELEMRLESVQVANEIYQDQLKDMQNKLDGNSFLSKQSDVSDEVDKDISTTEKDQSGVLEDDESEMYEAVNDLLVKCQQINQDDSVAIRKMMTTVAIQVDVDHLQPITTTCQHDVSTECVDSQCYMCTRCVCSDTVNTDDKTTVSTSSQTVHLDQSMNRGSQTDDIHQSVSYTQTGQVPLIICNSSTQTDSMEPEYKTETIDNHYMLDQPQPSLPMLCDAVVDCNLLDASFINLTFTESSTQTNGEFNKELIKCPICESIEQLAGTHCAGVSVQVQTDSINTQMSDDNLTIIMSDLRQSLKSTSQAIDGLDSYAATSGVFTATCMDEVTAAKSSTSASSSLNSESRSRGLESELLSELKRRSKDLGLQLAKSNGDICSKHGSKSNTNSSTSIHRTSTVLGDDESMEMVCQVCEQKEGSDSRLMNQMACTGTLLMVIILLIACCFLIGIGSYSQTFQRVGGRVGLPPH